MQVPSPSEMTKAWLVERYGTPGSPGWSPIVQGHCGEQTFSRTRTPVTMCWGSAQEVEADLGKDRVEISGYFCADESIARIARHADGHDLAIVDGRFLVDGWLAHVIEEGPCVLDLADPADLARAVCLHEPMGRWTITPHILERTEKAA